MWIITSLYGGPGYTWTDAELSVMEEALHEWSINHGWLPGVDSPATAPARRVLLQLHTLRSDQAARSPRRLAED